jgi:hypothetical protein
MWQPATGVLQSGVRPDGVLRPISATSGCLLLDLECQGRCGQAERGEGLPGVCTGRGPLIDIELETAERASTDDKSPLDFSASLDYSDVLRLTEPEAAFVPFMITKAQRERLLELGHTESAIFHMTPAVAQTILAVPR